MIKSKVLINSIKTLPRVNIGSALLFRLPVDLKLRQWQLDTALSVFFVAYVVFEIPASILMKRVKPHVFCEFSYSSF